MGWIEWIEFLFLGGRLICLILGGRDCMTCMVYTVTNCWDCAGIRMPRQVAEGFTDGPTSTAVLRIPQHLPPLWWAPFWHAVQNAVQVHPVCKV